MASLDARGGGVSWCGRTIRPHPTKAIPRSSFTSGQRVFQKQIPKTQWFSGLQTLKRLLPSFIRTIPSTLEFHQVLHHLARVGCHHRSGIGRPTPSPCPEGYLLLWLKYRMRERGCQEIRQPVNPTTSESGTPAQTNTCTRGAFPNYLVDELPS
jgi:hypothetical protein